MDAKRPLGGSPHNNKVVLIGGKGVGKSTLVVRLCKDRFKPNSEATIGAAFISHKFQHPDREVILNIWDTAGQDRFDTFLPLYIREVDVALVCFEFPKLEKIQKYVSIVRGVDPSAHVVLVATKIDLHAPSFGASPFGAPRYPEVEKYAEGEDLKVFYPSALSGRGVLNLFTNVAEVVMSTEGRGTFENKEFITIPRHCCHY